MAWHNFIKDHDYARDVVVEKLKGHIESEKVKSPKQKRLYMQQIANCGHSIIRYSPRSEGGWGSSPMNPRNWQTRDGNPICETKSVPKDRRK